MIENRYYSFTEKEPYLANDTTYALDEAYSAFCLIKTHVAFKLRIDFKTDSLSEISIKDESDLNNKGYAFLDAYANKEIEIIFKPISIGQKNFQLFITPPREKEKVLLFEKKLQVKNKSVVSIEGKIEEKLPASMKVGAKAEVIFSFKNKSNQAVKDLTIDISKQAS